jgi:hypothetical protein
MEFVDNFWVFHLIIESDISLDQDTVSEKIDFHLSECNDQWKLFRSRKKIRDIATIVVPCGTIRRWLISLHKMHEQSKIPHLSDRNFGLIIQPLLAYIECNMENQ